MDTILIYLHLETKEDWHSGINYVKLRKSILLRTQDETLYNQSLYEEKANKHLREIKFQVGDLVFLESVVQHKTESVLHERLNR